MEADIGSVPRRPRASSLARATGIATAALAVLAGWVVIGSYVAGQPLSRDPSQDRRQEVVRLIEAGEIAPDAASYGTLVALPDEYVSASDTGEVVVFRGDPGVVTVVFFTKRGVIDYYEGIMYWGHDGKFCCDDPLGGRLLEATEIEPGWYRIRAN